MATIKEIRDYFIGREFKLKDWILVPIEINEIYDGKEVYIQLICRVKIQGGLDRKTFSSVINLMETRVKYFSEQNVIVLFDFDK